MAHTIVGIDLGCARGQIRAGRGGLSPVARAGVLRRAGASGRGAAGRAPGRGAAPRAGPAAAEATMYLAMPGELLTVRVLDLPFSDPRKIEQVVGYELEGQIVHALSEVVFDHLVLETPGPRGDHGDGGGRAHRRRGRPAGRAWRLRPGSPRALPGAAGLRQPCFGRARPAAEGDGAGLPGGDRHRPPAHQRLRPAGTNRSSPAPSCAAGRR